MAGEFQPVPLSPSPPLPSPSSRRSGSGMPSRLNPHVERTSRQLISLQREGSSGSSSGHDAPRNSSSTSVTKDGSQPLDATSLGVLSGAVGGSFGPFPRSSTYANYAPGQAPFNRRDSIASSDVAIDVGGGMYVPEMRYSIASLDSDALLGTETFGKEKVMLPPDESLLWDKSKPDVDDYLHNPDPEIERMLDKQWTAWSFRGWFNVGLLVTIIIVLVGLFAGWPIYRFVIKGGFPNGSNINLGYNIGGINSTGQVPNTGLPNLIDKDTPQAAYTRTGFDGEAYNLVFSDEFNVEGRTFWPGDDPWWEAVDLHYWATVDLEWYDPDAITTRDGKLVITLAEEPIHDLNFRSGMLQGWNKFCFQGGYIEVMMSYPGTPKAQGFWPGVWTMGNLGRAGYGGTNDGMWPYSYDSCDVGTLPNQTWPNGTSPVAAKKSGDPDYGGELSYLPGQRASACTCAGEDHPGPNVGVGRGAPEIDINEGQVDYRLIGSASQSVQLAPMDAGYLWRNSTPYINIWNTSGTFQNVWQGSVEQESMSVITLSDRTSYENAGYTSFGYEYDPGPDGRITWAMNGTQTWQLNAAAIGPNTDSEVAQRLISEEPMSINLNLAISTKFQYPEWGKLAFPAHLWIDYVRVYQKGTPKISCDPADHPTRDYINRHLDTYNNPNITTWLGNANNTWPKNSLSAKGC